MKLKVLLVAAVLLTSAVAASAQGLSVDIRPSKDNPMSPQMGDNLSFQTVIRNDGATPIHGLIAWISLVRLDKGHEQPVDLEDWSAQKAVTATVLPLDRSLTTDWPVRLIQAGNYRVVVSAVGRDVPGLTASPFADFIVRSKPVVESQRVLPVAFGVPLLIGGAMLWRRRRSWSRAR